MCLVRGVRDGLAARAGEALAGWLRGLSLDERGLAQAAALGARLAQVPLAAIVSSPVERCRETAEAIASRQQREQDQDQPVPDRPAPDPAGNGSAPPSVSPAATAEIGRASCWERV